MSKPAMQKTCACVKIACVWSVGAYMNVYEDSLDERECESGAVYSTGIFMHVRFIISAFTVHTDVRIKQRIKTVFLDHLIY